MTGDVDAALRASRAMLGIIARSVAPALEEVSLPHFRVLVLLETAGPTRISTLAARLGAIVSTFSRSLDRLESAGWVTRGPGTGSRREVTVSITPRGSDLVRKVSDTRAAELAAAFALVADTDRPALSRAFTAFADAAGEPALDEMLVLGI